MVFPQPAQLAYFEETCYRDKNHRREDWLRQVAQGIGEEQNDERSKQRCDQAGKRGPRAAAFIDERLRHAAAHWKTVTEAGRKVSSGEGQKLLVAIETVAMLF